MTKNGDGAPGYPRVYRADKTIRIIFTSLAALLAVLPLRMVFSQPNLSAVLFFLPAIWAMAFFFLYSVNQQVILYADAIEKITWFSRRTISRNEILGWYGSTGYRGGYTYFLVPRAQHARRMRLMPVFRWDKAFFDWKKSIPHIKRCSSITPPH